jgi:hypothetical protein
MNREIYERITEADRTRFESKINKIPSGCWEWTGSRHKKGHGYFSIRNDVIYAHRFSYSLYVGRIPDGMLVCHRCDNGWCVNPDHLFVGTSQDNTDDMMIKGRNVFFSGSKCPTSKLSPDQVSKITSLYGKKSAREVGRMFGVTHSRISAIWHKESYIEESEK